MRLFIHNLYHELAARWQLRRLRSLTQARGWAYWNMLAFEYHVKQTGKDLKYFDSNEMELFALRRKAFELKIQILLDGLRHGFSANRNADVDLALSLIQSSRRQPLDFGVTEEILENLRDQKIPKPLFT